MIHFSHDARWIGLVTLQLVWWPALLLHSTLCRTLSWQFSSAVLPNGSSDCTAQPLISDNISNWQSACSLGPAVCSGCSSECLSLQFSPTVCLSFWLLGLTHRPTFLPVSFHNFVSTHSLFHSLVVMQTQFIDSIQSKQIECCEEIMGGLN